MKIAILWTELSGYMNACLRELSRINNVQLFVVHQTPSENAPFDKEQFSWIANRYEYKIAANKHLLLNKLLGYNPDVFYVCSWHIPEYRYILKKFSGKAFNVLFMDNPWKGTPKQWCGIISSRWYLHRLYDAVFLPGEPQARFARKLGFPQRSILLGGYSCDHSKFAAVYRQRFREHMVGTRSFIYVGRFSKEKGIDSLAKAYLRYQSSVSRPWPLICCGTGNRKKVLEGIRGIEVHGFIQPDDLLQKFAQTSCLVLPSTFEPWGVVIHEASASGLAVICSSVCGASVHLVQDGYNGYIVEAGNPDDLANAMLRYSKLSDTRKREMSANSFNLSLQFTPERWATYFCERVTELMKDRLARNYEAE